MDPALVHQAYDEEANLKQAIMWKYRVCKTEDIARIRRRLRYTDMVYLLWEYEEHLNG